MLLYLLDEGLRKLELGRLDIVKLVLQVATGHSSVRLPQWGLCHVVQQDLGDALPNDGAIFYRSFLQGWDVVSGVCNLQDLSIFLTVLVA